MSIGNNFIKKILSESFAKLMKLRMRYLSKYIMHVTTMYFKGRVTLFFANNYLTEYRITMEF